MDAKGSWFNQSRPKFDKDTETTIKEASTELEHLMEIVGYHADFCEAQERLKNKVIKHEIQHDVWRTETSYALIIYWLRCHPSIVLILLVGWDMLPQAKPWTLCNLRSEG